ncbi:MAG: hypothetical protein HY782_24250 [Chloroflexi bacterium]|nr:hypothetical protein [Chloroflexota bacterium]
MSYIAIGTANWTRVSPPNGGTYSGNLGNYQVEWTNANGNPGFTSVKFTPTFSGFSQGASDILRVVVTGFDPNTPIQVQAHAGQTTETFTFQLNNPNCQP